MVYDYPNFTNTSTGLEDLACYVTTNVPSFTASLLLMIFLVITIGGYSAERKRLGRGNFFLWASIGGTITTILSFSMLMYTCLINTETAIISAVITFACVLLFLITDRDD